MRFSVTRMRCAVLPFAAVYSEVNDLVSRPEQSIISRCSQRIIGYCPNRMNSSRASLIVPTESIHVAPIFALICDAFAFAFVSVVRRCFDVGWMLSGRTISLHSSKISVSLVFILQMALMWFLLHYSVNLFEFV